MKCIVLSIFLRLFFEIIVVFFCFVLCFMSSLFLVFDGVIRLVVLNV